MEAYEPSAFKTLTLRVDKATRTAEAEGLSSLYYGDSLTVVLAGISGLDVTKLVFGVYSEAGDLLSSVSGSWAFVPGRKDAVYGLVSLLTGNAETLAASLTVGRPVDVWLCAHEETGRTVLETSLPFYRSLSVSGGGAAGEISSYPTRAELAALAASVAAMPAMNDFDRNRRMEVLLAGLQALAV